jgi:hypothetical protein
LSGNDQVQESQAHIDAGAAVWGAALVNLLNVPEITKRVAELANCGFSEPDTTTNKGAECANLFFDVMSDFIYPMGEAIAPYDSFTDYENCSFTADDEIRHRQSERKAEATGCRILADIVETKSERTADRKTGEKDGANSANTSKLFFGDIPKNPDIVDLVIRFDAEKSKPMNERRSLNEIAREFKGETKGKDKESKSLVSQIRRMKREGRINL